MMLPRKLRHVHAGHIARTNRFGLAELQLLCAGGVAELGKHGLVAGKVVVGFVGGGAHEGRVDAKFGEAVEFFGLALS